MLFGLGENYYYYNFWDKGAATSELLGIEGVHMKYLLERGIVGLILYILYYVVLIRRLLKIRHFNGMVSGLAVSVVISYLSFAFMTGEQHSLYPSLFFAGVAFGGSQHILESKFSE